MFITDIYDCPVATIERTMGKAGYEMFENALRNVLSNLELQNDRIAA